MAEYKLVGNVDPFLHIKLEELEGTDTRVKPSRVLLQRCLFWGKLFFDDRCRALWLFQGRESRALWIILS